MITFIIIGSANIACTATIVFVSLSLDSHIFDTKMFMTYLFMQSFIMATNSAQVYTYRISMFCFFASGKYTSDLEKHLVDLKSQTTNTNYMHHCSYNTCSDCDCTCPVAENRIF